MVGGDDDQGLVPRAVGFDPLNDRLNGVVEVDLLLDHAASEVVVVGPVDRAAFDQEKESVGVLTEYVERSLGHRGQRGHALVERGVLVRMRGALLRPRMLKRRRDLGCSQDLGRGLAASERLELGLGRHRPVTVIQAAGSLASRLDGLPDLLAADVLVFPVVHDRAAGFRGLLAAGHGPGRLLAIRVSCLHAPGRAVVIEVGIPGPHDHVEHAAVEHLAGDVLVIVAIGCVGVAKRRGRGVRPLDGSDHAGPPSQRLGQLGHRGLDRLVEVAPVDRVVVSLLAGREGGRRGRRVRVVGRQPFVAAGLVPRFDRIIDHVRVLLVRASRLGRCGQREGLGGQLLPFGAVEPLGPAAVGGVPFALIHAGRAKRVEAGAVGDHQDHVALGGLVFRSSDDRRRNQYSHQQRRQQLAHHCSPSIWQNACGSRSQSKHALGQGLPRKILSWTPPRFNGLTPGMAGVALLQTRFTAGEPCA